MELAIALVIVATVGTIAIPSYLGYQERTRVSGAVSDIRQLETAIEVYRTEFGALPTELGHATGNGMLDPWENSYEYLNLEVLGSGVPGQCRKDKNLVPLNTDYDLYSKGADGESKLPLTPKESHDDVIRANDGAYVGLASKY